LSETTEVVAANLIVRDDGSVLLVRESKPSALGRWSLPAGRVERGETLRAAARREAREETGYVVEVGALIGIHHAPQTLEGGSAVVFVFRSTVVGGDVAQAEHDDEVEYVSRARLDQLIRARMIRGQHVAVALDAHDRDVVLPADLVIEVPASLPPRA